MTAIVEEFPRDEEWMSAARIAYGMNHLVHALHRELKVLSRIPSPDEMGLLCNILYQCLRFAPQEAVDAYVRACIAQEDHNKMTIQ